MIDQNLKIRSVYSVKFTQKIWYTNYQEYYLRKIDYSFLPNFKQKILLIKSLKI